MTLYCLARSWLVRQYIRAMKEIPEVPFTHPHSRPAPFHARHHSSATFFYSVLSYITLVLWMQPRTSHKSPAMSSSEFSLLGERTQEKRQFSSRSVTPPRVRRSTALVCREVTNWYVLTPSDTSDLIVYPDSTRTFDRG